MKRKANAAPRRVAAIAGSRVGRVRRVGRVYMYVCLVNKYLPMHLYLEQFHTVIWPKFAECTTHFQLVWVGQRQMVDVANNSRHNNCESVRSIVNCPIWSSRIALASLRRNEAVHEFQLQLLAGTRTSPKCRNYRKISCPALPLVHAPEIIILSFRQTPTLASWQQQQQQRGEFK